MSSIREILNRTEEGRQALAELSAPPANGMIMELITAPISAELVNQIREALGDTIETFATRLDVNFAECQGMCRLGINRAGHAAMFRLMVLEGMDRVENVREIGPELTAKIVDILGGVKEFSKEIGIAELTAGNWVRSGVPGGRSRWPEVFQMTLPFLFAEKEKR